MILLEYSQSTTLIIDTSKHINASTDASKRINTSIDTSKQINASKDTSKRIDTSIDTSKQINTSIDTSKQINTSIDISIDASKTPGDTSSAKQNDSSKTKVELVGSDDETNSITASTTKSQLATYNPLLGRTSIKE